MVRLAFTRPSSRHGQNIAGILKRNSILREFKQTHEPVPIGLDRERLPRPQLQLFVPAIIRLDFVEAYMSAVKSAELERYSVLFPALEKGDSANVKGVAFGPFRLGEPNREFCLMRRKCDSKCERSRTCLLYTSPSPRD